MASAAKSKERVAKRYDRWSRYYDAVDTLPGVSKSQMEWRMEAVELLDVKGDSVVLDAGTGSGLIIPWIAERLEGGKVVGTDISGKMLEVARKRAEAAGVADRVELVKDDIEASSFADGYFDRAIATFTLTTVPDPRGTLENMSRVLKKGGLLVILDTGRPTSLGYKIIFPFIKFSARTFGYTYIDRDIIDMVRGIPALEFVSETRHMGGMVYCLVCRKT